MSIDNEAWDLYIKYGEGVVGSHLKVTSFTFNYCEDIRAEDFNVGGAFILGGGDNVLDISSFVSQLVAVEAAAVGPDSRMIEADIEKDSYLLIDSGEDVFINNTIITGNVYLINSSGIDFKNNTIINHSLYIVNSTNVECNEMGLHSNYSENRITSIMIDDKSSQIIGKSVMFNSYPTNISFTCGGGVNITGLHDPPPELPGLGNISRFINATNLSASSWLNVTFHYNDTDLGSVDESYLALYRYSEAEWVLVPGSYVDVDSNNVSANITEFSIIAPLGSIPVENIPPTTNIISPSNNTVVSDMVTIQGSASDVNGDDTIEIVEISIDGGEWKAVTGTDFWSFQWDTTTVANGKHVLRVRAFDGTDYSKIAEIHLVVQNVIVENAKPTVVIISPENNSKLSGDVTITGNASDEDGSITSVEISINNESWISVNGTTSWNYVWDSTLVANGDYEIRVRSFDGEDYSVLFVWNVTVENKKDDDDDEGGFLCGFVIIGLITVVGVVMSNSNWRKH